MGLDAETRTVIAESLREMFAARTGRASLAPLLAELGWADVLAEDPRAAVGLLFTEHGRALASSRALDDVVLAELPEVTAADLRRAVVYPSGTIDLPPAGGPIDGVVLGSLDDVDEVVVPAAGAQGTPALFVVPVADVRGSTAPLGGFDPDTGWTAIAGLALGDPVAIPAGQGWERAVAAGRRALSAEILGICDAVMALVTAHTTARVQFNRPIGSFQAVRHRLAEAAVAIAGAHSVLDAAWDGASSPDGGGWAAKIAKVRVGRAQAELMRNAVQVFGALGLTQEGDLHRYVTRAAALDALLGGHRLLTEVVGRAVLDGVEDDSAFGF
ncbi:acyl-CoA dehydrogenase family protein [Nocardia jiangxiensis]|uniref:acyl-CoA dehydrogenase family protein n=1 Tax=Nocardia jiangxiensis TaxID=282685 RepID=UPI0002E2F380|nr:acyl-CoA dehydrogenase family protein [Nocardia jiangxiensis]